MTSAANLHFDRAESVGYAKARHGQDSLSPLADDERRAERRYACNYRARVASSDRTISTAATIVNISKSGAKVEVMYPRRGPTTIMLHDEVNGEIYECEVRWRTDDFVGVRFLDVFGPGRRRKFLAGEPVPLRASDHKIIQLECAPKEKVQPGPPRSLSDTRLPQGDVRPGDEPERIFIHRYVSPFTHC